MNLITPSGYPQLDIDYMLKNLLTKMSFKSRLGNEDLKLTHYKIAKHPVQKKQEIEECRVIEERQKKKKKKNWKSQAKGKSAKPLKENYIDAEETSSLVVSIPLKRAHQIRCPICGIEFPSNFNNEQIDEHANKCIDDMENIDCEFSRNSDNRTHKRRKIKSQERRSGQSINDNVLVENVEDRLGDDCEVDEVNRCQECLLFLKYTTEKFKKQHLLNCKIEQENLKKSQQFRITL